MRDKGYIGQALFENLFLNGIQLVTKVKNNMKNSLMSIADKILLRKRALLETVNDELKNIAQIEHSRHRSFNNFVANSLSVVSRICSPMSKKATVDYLRRHFKEDVSLQKIYRYLDKLYNS